MLVWMFWLPDCSFRVHYVFLHYCLVSSFFLCVIIVFLRNSWLMCFGFFFFIATHWFALVWVSILVEGLLFTCMLCFSTLLHWCWVFFLCNHCFFDVRFFWRNSCCFFGVLFFVIEARFVLYWFVLLCRFVLCWFECFG